MSIQEHIRQTADLFFACTRLPIRTFDFSGDLINAAGYHRQLQEEFDQYAIFEQVLQAMLEREEDRPVIVACRDSVFFAACWVCGRNINRGFHILGPYTSVAASETALVPYKPAQCIPHLFTLLGNIAGDSAFLQQKIKRYHSLPYSTYIKKALDYLDARYNEPTGLADVAVYLNISKCYLCSLFKRETGRSLSQYLNEIRIEKSKELLHEEDLSILEIALAVGFSNQNYYSVMFKRLTSYTPQSYRSQMAKNLQKRRTLRKSEPPQRVCAGH
ncbi:MAG: AraC family transcriptional regulator [Sporomusaceae bacterium]|nr:AraC family transcriptional regulator [Sporomusaceae bacterium]